MRKIFLIAVIFALSASINGCHINNKQPELTNQDVHKVIAAMGDVMIHDVTNPPLAARFFAYACLAGYEIVSENDKKVKNLHGVLNEYPAISKPKGLSGYDYRLSAVFAILETAAKLQPSGKQNIIYEQSLADSCNKIGFDRDVISHSLEYAQFVSKKILAYAKADKYNRISNYPRYKLKGGPGTWEPTQPAYLPPVEPYFNTMRPLTLDSAAQFASNPAAQFSVNKNAAFYKLLLLNYAKSGSDLTPEQKNIANFWDCNPFAVQNEGHMLIGLKKISPGAHWMGIAAIACKQTNASFSKTVEVNTILAIGLMDGFICCWDEKYRTNRIRPETAIREYIDPNWKPFLQTPPFPEYTSGHSVVSSLAAVILAHYFGKNFHYTDDVEINFGVPPRKFSSFEQAAKEAAISRFWGGIHFMDAINNGVSQGAQVGYWVLAKTRNL